MANNNHGESSRVEATVTDRTSQAERDKPVERVLVIDIGGSAVKLFLSGSADVRTFESGNELTPDRLVAMVRAQTQDWDYRLVSVGYPGKVGPDGPCEEAGNLGPGWVSFDFGAAFERPVTVVNDAILQAVGGYAGGRMLFLGLGTGLGSALVVERTMLELDLGGLPVDLPPHGKGEILSGLLGHKAFERDAAAWQVALHHTVERLRYAFLADYVLLGGGHADEVGKLPENTRRGGNEDAFVGGVLLWRDGFEKHGESRQGNSRVWRLLR